MSSRTRLSSLAATVLIAPGVLAMAANPAQAAPDPSSGKGCDETFVSHQQFDRTHVRVRAVAKICSTSNRMLSLTVERAGKKAIDTDYDRWNH